MNSQLSTHVSDFTESAHSHTKHTEESLASYLELISHQRWLSDSARHFFSGIICTHEY
jgi:hypothetical protein